ncbi:MAG: HDIG domain-containing protein [Syntrophorhabdaceae bacterium]|nr:HDIG domain-containing protein [Syntrophorhabdaceae bacterium]MDD4195454.1 HDIG domain-containing protein [Syntrophorhabdaceae bacterium]
MQNGKDKPPSYVRYGKILILLGLAVALALLVSIKSPYFIAEYQLGDIARENLRAPADFAVPGTDITVKKGEVIVREGERIGSDHLAKIAVYNNLERRDFFIVKKFLAVLVLLFLFIAVLYEYAEKNIKKFHLSKRDLLFCSVFTVFCVLLVKCFYLIFENYAQSRLEDLFYVIPIFVFAMVVRIVLFSEIAIIFSLVYAATLAFSFENSLRIFLYTFAGSILGAYFSGKCENRNTILKAGLFTAFLMCLFMIANDVYTGRSAGNVALRFFFIMVNGIAGSFIVLGLLPVIENVFDYTTDIKLLELANLEHPLLGDMMLNAAGTYHHSIVVGNLSKAAAEAIGAHPLLTRVASYYHDIGKLKMPHYYIENRTAGDDVHAGITPSMSALIIMSHVKEGVELAKDYKLGSKLTNIIKEHHGTSLVSFFYSKAKEQEDPSLHVIEEKDFRYPGPKPQTKEAGIIMLADAVEAASRVLDDPTPKRIETHVQRIIENIFLDSQLDECELTLKDLHAIQRSFINILIGIFHHRIEYPERTHNGGTDKKLAKTDETQPKTDRERNRGITGLFKASG